MTISTIIRIIRLADRVLRTKHQVFQRSGFWHYGWGLPGCMLDFSSYDNMEGDDGWLTKRDAAEALAEECLETMRDYSVDEFRAALTKEGV